LQSFSPDSFLEYGTRAKFELFDGHVRVRSALFYDIW